MYKCTDCGQEFEVKPDYCDCGNDTFEEIITENIQSVINSSVDKSEGHDLPKLKSSFSSDTGSAESIKYTRFDIPSVLIFLSCILLSILSVIYIGKDSLEQMEQNKNKQTKEDVSLVKNNNIPTIAKLWNDSHKTSEQTVPPLVNNQPAKTLPNNIVRQNNNQLSGTKAQNTIVPKKITVAKKTATSTVSKTLPKQVKQTAVKKTQTNTNVTVQKPAAPSNVQVQKPVVQQKVNTAQLQQEMANYKVSLMNKLANSVRFEKIVGDGSCSVSFKLDTAGNLINRRFAVQSDNDSLNNAVYSAIMNNPTYTSPPQGYKNETLIFSVKMYGGRFNVTLN